MLLFLQESVLNNVHTLQAYVRKMLRFIDCPFKLRTVLGMEKCPTERPYTICWARPYYEK